VVLDLAALLVRVLGDHRSARRPSGVRAVFAESVLVKQQLLILCMANPGIREYFLGVSSSRRQRRSISSATGTAWGCW
jgi:hypothetical protein